MNVQNNAFLLLPSDVIAKIFSYVNQEERILTIRIGGQTTKIYRSKEQADLFSLDRTCRRSRQILREKMQIPVGQRRAECIWLNVTKDRWREVDERYADLEKNLEREGSVIRTLPGPPLLFTAISVCFVSLLVFGDLSFSNFEGLGSADDFLANDVRPNPCLNWIYSFEDAEIVLSGIYGAILGEVFKIAPWIEKQARGYHERKSRLPCEMRFEAWQIEKEYDELLPWVEKKAVEEIRKKQLNLREWTDLPVWKDSTMRVLQLYGFFAIGFFMVGTVGFIRAGRARQVDLLRGTEEWEVGPFFCLLIPPLQCDAREMSAPTGEEFANYSKIPLLISAVQLAAILLPSLIYRVMTIFDRCRYRRK